MNNPLVLRALLKKETWHSVGSLLTADVLTNMAAQRALSIISDLHGETTGDLSVAGLRLSVESSIKAKFGVRDEILRLVDEIDTSPDLDPGEAISIIRTFAARELVQRGLYFGATNIDDDDFDLADIMKFFTRAEEILTGAEIGVEDFSRMGAPGDEYRTGLVPLGFHEDLDVALEGGIADGELALLLAPSGVGKTSYLWRAVTNAALRGRNVLGISLEIKLAKCAARVDSALTGMTRRELTTNPFRALDKRTELKGKIWIKDWSHREVRVADIRALIRQMEAKGQKVDYLMVDYMELLRPTYIDRKQPRFNFTAVAVELRRLANELKIPVLSAWQTNRGGADKHVLSATDVGEDWGIVKTADILIGMNQNAEELKERILRLNILKQRESTRRPIFYCDSDLDRMIVRKVGVKEVDLGEEVSSGTQNVDSD